MRVDPLPPPNGMGLREPEEEACWSSPAPFTRGVRRRCTGQEAVPERTLHPPSSIGRATVRGAGGRAGVFPTGFRGALSLVREHLRVPVRCPPLPLPRQGLAVLSEGWQSKRP